MKATAAIVSIAFLIIAGVLFSIVKRGAALKPAGVIKVAEVGKDPEFIGKQIAIRLFPDFDEAKHVIWRLEDNSQFEIAYTTLTHLRTHAKPVLIDLRADSHGSCTENCWYIQDLRTELPAAVAQQTKSEPTVEIFVQYFDREEKVPEACEDEKILDLDCIRPVSVREVRRKMKTPARQFFMQRYQKSQFYLFIERGSSGG